MRKISGFLASLVLVCGTAGVYSCEQGGDDNGGNGGGGDIPVPVPAPTGLGFSDVTDSEATLTWVAAEGIEQYEVTVGEGDPVSVSETTYTADDLDAVTEYAWQVRSIDGDRVSKWVPGPGFTTKKPAIPAPTGLTVEDVGSTEGSFSWTAAEGISEYQIRFNTGRNNDVTGTSYTHTALTAKTEYTWEVRSKVGKSYSAWVAGPQFETAAERVEFNPVTASAICQGAANYSQTPDMSEFIIQFNEFRTSDATRNGYSLMVDFVTPTVSLGSRQMDIPEATYTLVEEIPAKETGESVPTNSILPIFNNGLGTVLVKYDNGRQGDLLVPNGGTMTVSGNRSNYTIDIELVFGNRGEMILFGRWTGPIETINRTVESTFTEDVDLGVVTNLEEDYRQNAFGNGTADVYLYTAIGDGLSDNGQSYEGSGWLVFTQISTTINSGGVIPDRTYTVAMNTAAGYALAGYRTSSGVAGTWIQKIENGRVTGIAPVVSGTITVTAHTFVVDGRDDAGNKITGTFSQSTSAPAPLGAAAGSQGSPRWRSFAGKVDAVLPLDLKELGVR